jgi:hypothetical protein
MSKKKSPPKYLIIYACGFCGQDCGYTEREKPKCRFCGKRTGLTVVSKQLITPEVMTARLKTVTDRMMDSLIGAYEELPKAGENMVAEGKDSETELLKLLEKAKQLRDKVQGLKLR